MAPGLPSTRSIVTHRLSCSSAWGVFLDPGSDRVSCIGGWSLYHWAIREAQACVFKPPCLWPFAIAAAGNWTSTYLHTKKSSWHTASAIQGFISPTREETAPLWNVQSLWPTANGSVMESWLHRLTSHVTLTEGLNLLLLWFLSKSPRPSWRWSLNI